MKQKNVGEGQNSVSEPVKGNPWDITQKGVS